ncbi:tripartite motif-containing protein 12A-like [Heteronotia binoei]|uniref:tripartite motif-containing protein 12A-like n=1 Tax=Heteronotia binoei TaxID=13085 RepID=UPI00292EB0D4|nr:tripartite motif-containing protein 12A-like [Heteronotia binoei]
MAALGEHITKLIRQQAGCLACESFYLDPVQLPCGASFCRACVEELSPPVCPEPDCDATFDPARLKPNPTLARLVGIVKKLLEQEERRQREASAGGAAGGEAPRKDTLFCKQHRALLSKARYQPENHLGHDVLPADKAVQEYQVQIRKCFSHLKNEEKDILSNKKNLEVDSEYYIKQIMQTWEKTSTEFKQMEAFLEKQKKQLLAQVTQMCKEIKRNKDQRNYALSKKLSLLRNTIYELEDVSQLPQCQLLKNAEDVLQKFEERETVECRGSLCIDFQEKISSLARVQMFVIDAMTKFRENMTGGITELEGFPSPNPNGMALPVVGSEEPQIGGSEEPQIGGSEEPQIGSILDEAQPSNPESSGLQSE